MKTIILALLASIALSGCAIMEPSKGRAYEWRIPEGKTDEEITADTHRCRLESYKTPNPSPYFMECMRGMEYYLDSFEQE